MPVKGREDRGGGCEWRICHHTNLREQIEKSMQRMRAKEKRLKWINIRCMQNNHRAHFFTLPLTEHRFNQNSFVLCRIELDDVVVVVVVVLVLGYLFASHSRLSPWDKSICWFGLLRAAMPSLTQKKKELGVVWSFEDVINRFWCTRTGTPPQIKASWVVVIGWHVILIYQFHGICVRIWCFLHRAHTHTRRHGVGDTDTDPYRKWYFSSSPICISILVKSGACRLDKDTNTKTKTITNEIGCLYRFT